jgi:hypothetical protein
MRKFKLISHGFTLGGAARKQRGLRRGASIERIFQIFSCRPLSRRLCTLTGPAQACQQERRNAEQ